MRDLTTRFPPVQPVPRLSLQPAEAAEALGIGLTTLQGMRNRGEGPPFVRLGSKVVLYPVPGLEAWLLEQSRRVQDEQAHKASGQGGHDAAA